MILKRVFQLIIVIKILSIVLFKIIKIKYIQPYYLKVRLKNPVL